MYECHKYIYDNNSCKYHTVTKQEKPQAMSRKKEGEMEYILYVCMQSSDAKESQVVIIMHMCLYFLEKMSQCTLIEVYLLHNPHWRRYPPC